MGNRLGKDLDLLHVLPDFDRPYDAAGGVGDGHTGSEILKPSPLLIDEIFLDMMEFLPLEAFQNAIIGKLKLGDMHADYLVDPAIQRLGGDGIEHRYSTIGIDGNHPVPDIVQDDAQPVFSCFLRKGVNRLKILEVRYLAKQIAELALRHLLRCSLELHVDPGLIIRSDDFHGHDAELRSGDPDLKYQPQFPIDP